MGIGVQALELMRYMRDEGLFRERVSVMELGSQTFAPNTVRARDAIAKLFPDVDPMCVEGPRDLYRALGLVHYKSIDLDGHDGALVFDLNRPLDEDYGFVETFDLVTNHGTTEHAFDQFRCFENVHNMTRPGGLMLHALPSQGYQNHAFYNYHPSFFLDLASSNGYDILGLYYDLDENLFAYTDSFLSEHNVRATDFVAVFAVLRRSTDSAFVAPFDGRYYFEERSGVITPRPDVGGHERVAENFFPLSARHASIVKNDIPRRPKIRFVLPVWGRPFINNFLAFGLRAQVSSGHLAIESPNESEYLIVTDATGARQFDASPLIEELRQILPVRVLIAEGRGPEGNYVRLTRYYNVALADAMFGDTYFFLTSDCFFSREVFRSALDRLKTHQVVLSPALRVVEETFVTAVMATNSWDTSGSDLLRLALQHEHPLTEAFSIGNLRNVNHPLPAQVLVRLPGGYVGRWTVMHPLAVRISNTLNSILQTIDWNFGVLQISGWVDVAVLDSLSDGLTLSTTPLHYNQDQGFRHGSRAAHHLENLKNWVNIRWCLEFHLAQIAHPVRLLSDPSLPSSEIEAAEASVESLIKRFFNYVNGRRQVPRLNFQDLSAAELLRYAIDRPQWVRAWGRVWERLVRELSLRLWKRIRAVLGR